MALAPALSGHGGVYMPPFQRVSTVRLQLQPVHHRSNPRPYTSFFIKDILGSKIGGVERENDTPTPCGPPTSPATPWPSAATGTAQPSPPGKDANFPVREAEKTLPTTPCGIIRDANGSPLSALEELANKTFTGLETSILRAAEAATINGKRDPLHLFNRQPPRKKRKSRTAFNNQQIFELERRFLYQKYLTPADRDEIASVLGLTNAQVITWFQNRRAKLKRDMEELTMDVTASSKKCSDITMAADEAAAATVPSSTADSSAIPKTSRFKEEEDGEDDEEDEDRLSAVSEQQRFGLRLASVDDNSQHQQQPHRHHVSPSAEEAHDGGAEPGGNRDGGAPGDASQHGAANTASCFASTAAAGHAEGEEVESMDCSTSPSSGFHSESEDK